MALDNVSNNVSKLLNGSGYIHQATLSNIMIVI